LRDHSSGLNCGRWDYIFSFIKKVRNRGNEEQGKERGERERGEGRERGERGEGRGERERGEREGREGRERVRSKGKEK
jgi:Malate synthase